MPNNAHPIDVHVGRRLRLQRLTRGMNQTALAEGVGITFQQVQKYENGINRISASRLFEFSRILGVDVGFFFGGLPALAVGEAPRRLKLSPAERTAERQTMIISRAFPTLPAGHRAAVFELIKALAA